MTRRRIAWLIVGGTAGAAALLWWRSTLPPVWWSPPNPRDERITALGEQVENGLVSVAHEIRPAGEPWAIRLREEQVNAWLAVRLPKWAAHHGRVDSAELPALLQVHFQPGAVRVGATLPESIRRGVLDVAIQPTMEDGQLRLTVARVALGRVAVSGEPLSALVNELKRLQWLDDLEGGGDEFEALARALLEGEPIEPVIELSDGRAIQLVDLMVSEGELVLQCRTEARQ